MKLQRKKGIQKSGKAPGAEPGAKTAGENGYLLTATRMLTASTGRVQASM